MDIMKIIIGELRKSQTGINQTARDTDLDPATICRTRQGRSVDVRAAGKLLDIFGYTLSKSGKKSKRRAKNGKHIDEQKNRTKAAAGRYGRKAGNDPAGQAAD